MTTYFDNLQRNYTGVSIMEECIETISIFLKKFGVVLSKIYIPEKLVNEQEPVCNFLGGSIFQEMLMVFLISYGLSVNRKRKTFLIDYLRKKKTKFNSRKEKRKY
ncbi:hypothetical protein RIR_e140_A0A2N0PQL4_9GLOM [Rhizophagus irregularis DAOM 181602=DAOM 197198]|nr:hypothetical protein RIR_e140_A0A2N0PQL4_9GLOM [Rhizophagus irregularis DAOM 181602=DAOM 197198]